MAVAKSEQIKEPELAPVITFGRHPYSLNTINIPKWNIPTKPPPDNKSAEFPWSLLRSKKN